MSTALRETDAAAAAGRGSMRALARAACAALVPILCLGCSGEDVEGERPPGQSLDFSVIGGGVDPAPEHTYRARDGSMLAYRQYGEGAPIDLIFVHGSGGANGYLAELGTRIAAAGVANVVTPDLRGHGARPERRGDVDYVDQLEDDLADLIAHLRRDGAPRKVAVGGHSSGGGFAIRFAGGAHAGLVDGHLLLAPFLGPDAATTRANSGGWASPRLGRIVFLSILNGFGIHALNGMTVLEFDHPESARTGLETSAYSFRMMAGFNPRDGEQDVAALCRPTLVLVGADDEAFYADRYAEVFGRLAPHARVELLPGVTHLAIPSSTAAIDAAIAWLGELPAGALADRCAG